MTPKDMGRRMAGHFCAGLLPLLKPRLLTVFCYHDITDRPRPFSRDFCLSLPPRLFDRQLGWIRRHFQVIGLDDLLRGEVPRNAALITFDDGFASVFANAIPLLEKHDLPATVFLSMAPVLGEPFWSAQVTWLCAHDPSFLHRLGSRAEGHPAPFLLATPEVVERHVAETAVDHPAMAAYAAPLATAADLARYAAHPLIRYGNHTMHHYVAATLAPAQFAAEYRENERLLADYAGYRPAFAFPFGQPRSCFDAGHLEAVRNLGARAVFHSSGGINRLPCSVSFDRWAPIPSHDSPGRFFYSWARAWLARRQPLTLALSEKHTGNEEPYHGNC